MTGADIAALRADLETAKAFLLHMAIREQALAVSGPHALADWDDFPAGIAALRSLELRLVQAVALAKDIAPELQDKLKSFAEKSPIALQAAEIAVNVEVAKARQVDGQVVVLARKTASIFSYFAGGGFIKKMLAKKPDLPIRQMVIDIDRLLPFVDALQAAADAKAAEGLAKPEPATIQKQPAPARKK